MRTLGGETAMHKGIDIVYEDGFVRAFAGGIVKASLIIRDKLNKTWEWGEYVRVDGYDGKKYYYCHMDSRSAKVGDEVKLGDILGVMGSTGKSTGPHTHFEIRNKFGDSLNPSLVLDFIKNVRGTYEMIADKVAETVEEAKEVEKLERYDTLEQVPNWAKPTIKKLLDKKLLLGDNKGNLALSDDLIRMLVINDRAKLYD
jgi:murein DD-endopeptidase MepM/ murein hydrolase activator NlpD